MPPFRRHRRRPKKEGRRTGRFELVCDCEFRISRFLAIVSAGSRHMLVSRPGVYTDEKALIKSYGKLLDVSKNHLRAYVAQIEKTIGEGNYVAQYLTQEEVDEILGR